MLETSSIESGAARPIDKSKFDLFKPLSLDVIFHGCKILAIFKGILMLL